MKADDATIRIPDGHTAAAKLKPGTRIVDPLQTDVWDHLIQVDHVGDLEPDGMVTVEGRRGSGATCQVRVAGDWPVRLWTSELAVFEAALLDGENRDHLPAPRSSTMAGRCPA